MADKRESREVKAQSKVERVQRQLKLLDSIVAKALKSKGNRLSDELYLNENGELLFTRGSLKEYDNEEQDLYGYLHYLLMKTSSHITKVEKEGKGKQFYSYKSSVSVAQDTIKVKKTIKKRSKVQ